MGNIEFNDQEVFERLWNLSNCSMLSIEERRKYERSLKAYRDYVNQMDFARAEGRAERKRGGKSRGQNRRAYQNNIYVEEKGRSDEQIASLLDLDIEEVKSV